MRTHPHPHARARALAKMRSQIHAPVVKGAEHLLFAWDSTCQQQHFRCSNATCLPQLILPIHLPPPHPDQTMTRTASHHPLPCVGPVQGLQRPAPPLRVTDAQSPEGCGRAAAGAAPSPPSGSGGWRWPQLSQAAAAVGGHCS